ncbi:MAG: GNAT family N-acetyltransferase [Sphingobium sp.]|nr:GNAT family N-acetyltransferase [Sphingobium sp.]MCI1271213.1 GNAT family N-acetyltransferase [Sphingobium sp.]MCI1755444.1 GNAT family N-acetyltransferase [Sphingobium sp.]MCI2052186.1 GNAT family N-acetyltransferase [Sphingobium sp.]
MADRESASSLVARTAAGVSSIDPAQWDACAGDGDPFLSHAFLAALEESGSVGPGTGWQASPILIDDAQGAPLGILPAYFKGHSQGEYVFDHGWADAWERAGGRYYPKLQIAVPFTPVTGKRLLLREDAPPAIASGLIAAAEQLVAQHGLSSAHATFVAPQEVPLFEAAGWLLREDSQFHFENEGYADFEAFLGQLSSEKRKNLRKERRRAQEGLEIVHLTGDAIRPEHWDAFWVFYQDTGARKWGRPYLTRSFFDLAGARMADKILLILALRDGLPIAGALNFIGADTLYGRYWGCTEEVPFLHFELCYYQAIDFALAHGLSRVEAGAQGGHKLVRGYKPVATWSAHHVPHPDFRRAVAQFLAQERAAVSSDREWLSSRTPFKNVD